MKTIGPWIRRATNLISFAALAMLTGCVLWGVLTRYVTEKPAVWTTELSGILFTWVVFIGVMSAQREGRHIRVTLLIDILPESAKRHVVKASEIIVLVFLIYVAYLSFEMMQNGATRPSPVLRIPFLYVYLATAICFVGMSITSALMLFGLIERPDPTPAGDDP